MKIKVSEIKDKPVSLSSNEPAEHYPALVAVAAAGEASFLKPIQADLSIVKEYDLVRVAGIVGTRVRLSCSRCLSDFESDIDSSFTVFYSRSTGEPLDEEVELREEDLVSATYEGDEIDFTPIIEEQVVMGLPLKPLCKEECSGLCSNCGTDLNTSSCSCDHSSVNLKFSALQNLKIEK